MTREKIIKTATDTVVIATHGRYVYMQLDIACRQLTPTQARRIARALLEHANGIMPSGDTGGTTP